MLDNLSFANQVIQSHSHPLKDVEKNDIRTRIIDVVAALTDETSIRLAAAAIGKMARLDLPDMWYITIFIFLFALPYLPFFLEYVFLTRAEIDLLYSFFRPNLPLALHGMLQSCPLQGLPVIQATLEEYKGARTKLLRAAVKDRVMRLYQPLHECFRGHYVAWITRAPHDPVPK